MNYINKHRLYDSLLATPEEIGRVQFNLATPTYATDADRCIQRTLNTV